MMFGKFSIGRQFINMGSGFIGRRDPFSHTFPIQGAAIQVSLGGIIGRGHEVDQVIFFIYQRDLYHIVIPGSNQYLVFTIPADPVQMTPSVFFAGP